MKNDITIIPLEKKSEEYTDERLEILRPDIADSKYSRGLKMSLDLFDGGEVEYAFEEGGRYVSHVIMDSQGTLADVEEEYGEGGLELWLHILGTLRVLED